VVHSEVLATAGLEHRQAWAFGLGLERLAMVLFAIPDIRLFWSTDKRFTSQFRDGEMGKFEAYSKYPPCYKDVSFWLPDVSVQQTQEQGVEGMQGMGVEGVGQTQTQRAFHSNDVYEVIRDVAGDLVERVELFDTFSNKKGRRSHAYRIYYRHMDRSLTNAEVDEVQVRVRSTLVGALAVELR
jgi:phenylalanyl-tRNA synthetase alpha chain